MSERPPTADTLLTDFVTLHYMRNPHHRSGKIPGKHVWYKLIQICDHLDAILNRKPVVSDLNAANLKAVEEYGGQTLQHRRNTVRQYRDAFKGLWRYAADLELVPMADEMRKKSYVWNPDHDGNAVKLSDDDETLWGICLKKYFPRNIRIRCASTKQQYQYALRDFKQFLGHDPTAADLTEDNVVGMMAEMRARNKSPKTCNERAGRLAALWGWMAKRRLVNEFPTFKRLKNPKRIPKAWTREELSKLLDACQHVGGKVGNVWSSDWWVALHLVLWDTGARIGEIRALKWEWIDFATGDVLIPAEFRKAQERDMLYRLHADTLAALNKIRGNDSPFGTMSGDMLYYEYRRIRKAAGVQSDRGSGFHKIRRSVASHIHAAGHNATDVLGHATSDVTRASYLDPRIIGASRPSEILFRPGAARVEVELPPDDGLIVMGIDEPHERKRLPRAKPLPPEPIEDVAPELAWL